MAHNRRSLALFYSVPYGSGGAKVNFFVCGSADAAATILAAGYFNDDRSKLQANDIILAVAAAGGTGDFLMLRVTSSPASGNVLTELTSGGEVGGSARAVVPTADGLTTGLILASDTYISLAAADANHWATLPAIADVALGKRIVAKNGSTGCELRTPASSGTKINNGAADSNEAIIAANASVFIEKTAADNWSVLTATGGAVACPTPD